MHFHSDVSQGALHVLDQLVSQDLVKLSQAIEVDVSSLPHQSFADCSRRQLLLTSKEACIVSAAYAGRFHQDNPEVFENLKTAAALWNCTEEVEQTIKEASREIRDTRYAVDVHYSDMKIQHYPYKDVEGFKKAAADFYAHRTKFPRSVRKQAAVDITRVSEELKADLDDDVREYCEKAAGWGEFDPEAYNVQVILRRIEAKGQYNEKIAGLVSIGKELEPGFKCAAEFAADALSAYDEEVGFYRRYGRITTLPEELVVGKVLSKLAAEEGTTVKLQNGKTVDLAGIDWNSVQAFDPELAAAVDGSIERAKEILPTWPRPDADTFVTMLGL